MTTIRADELQPGDVVKFTALPHVTGVYFYVREVKTYDCRATIRHGIPEIGDEREPVTFPCGQELTVVARGVSPDMTNAVDAKLQTNRLLLGVQVKRNQYHAAQHVFTESKAMSDKESEKLWASIIPQETTE